MVENTTAPSTEQVILTCCICGRQHESARSPVKKYRVWQGRTYCSPRLKDGKLEDADKGHNCFNDHVQTRVYKFGAAPERKAGKDNAELANEQRRKMNRLRNAWVVIDNNERTEYRRLTADPALVQEEERLAENLAGLLEAVSVQKVKGRRKKIKNPQLDADIKATKADLKKVRDDLKLQRETMKVTNAPLIKQLRVDTDAAFQKAMKDAKAGGLLYTNANHLLANFKTASKKARKEGTMLRFHRFDGTGCIYIDETNGLDLADAYSTEEKGNFQIGPVIKTLKGAGKNRTSALRDVRTRVGSGDKGVPVWLKVPLIFHRDLPEGCTIQNVCVTLRKVADTQVWSTNIAVRMPAAKRRVSDALNSSDPETLAIDLGWRKMSSGLRVAYWRDTAGNHGELLLPHNQFGAQFQKLHDLQSIMDKRFDEIRDLLAPWLRINQALPDSVRQACCGRGGVAEPRSRAEKEEYQATTGQTFSVGRWKAHQRMVRLLRVWSRNRFVGDDQMFTALSQWYNGDPSSKPAHFAWKGTDSWGTALKTRKDTKPNHLYNGHRHLWLWWCHLNDQLQKRRDDFYRCFARKIAKDGYKQVVIEDFDLRDVAEKPKVEDALKPVDPLRDVSTKQDKAARKQRVEASVSSLRGAIANVCGREGIRLLRVEPAWTTRECHVCDGMVRVNLAKAVIVHCDCDSGLPAHHWDQDHNACKNMLDLALPPRVRVAAD